MILNRIVAFRLMQRFGFVPKGAKKVSGKKSLLFGLTLFSLAAFLFVFWEELLDASKCSLATLCTVHMNFRPFWLIVYGLLLCGSAQLANATEGW